MKKGEIVFQWFETKIGLSTKKERIWFWCVFILLVLYVEFAVYAQNTVYGGNTSRISALYAIFVCPVCFWGALKCSHIWNVNAARSDVLQI